MFSLLTSLESVEHLREISVRVQFGSNPEPEIFVAQPYESGSPYRQHLSISESSGPQETDSLLGLWTGKGPLKPAQQQNAYWSLFKNIGSLNL